MNTEEEGSELKKFFDRLPHISCSKVREIIQAYELDITQIKNKCVKDETDYGVQEEVDELLKEKEESRYKDVSAFVNRAKEIINLYERTCYRTRSCSTPSASTSSEEYNRTSKRGRKRIYNDTERKWQKWRNNYVFYLKKQIEREILDATLTFEESKNRKLKSQINDLEMEIQKVSRIRFRSQYSI